MSLREPERQPAAHAVRDAQTGGAIEERGRGVRGAAVVLDDDAVVRGRRAAVDLQALLRLVLQLMARPGALLLIEEPECHQHPRAIGQTCRAIWAAVRQDVQVVLTTHSLDLIDSLLAEAKTDEELDKLAIFNVHLEDGVLSAVKSGGREAAFARAEIANDLR